MIWLLSNKGRVEDAQSFRGELSPVILPSEECLKRAAVRPDQKDSKKRFEPSFLLRCSPANQDSSLLREVTGLKMITFASAVSDGCFGPVLTLTDL